MLLVVLQLTDIGYRCRDQLWNATRSSVTYIKYISLKNFDLISLFLSMNQPATVSLQDDQWHGLLLVLVPVDVIFLFEVRGTFCIWSHGEYC
jgi:hypothetical protein